MDKKLVGVSKPELFLTIRAQADSTRKQAAAALAQAVIVLGTETIIVQNRMRTLAKPIEKTTGNPTPPTTKVVSATRLVLMIGQKIRRIAVNIGPSLVNLIKVKILIPASKDPGSMASLTRSSTFLLG